MRYIILLFASSLFVVTASFAQVVDTGSNPSLTFQIIQDQFIFDNSTIKSATIVMHQNNTYEGLLIDLKPEVVERFKLISSVAMGKTVNFVLNKKMVVATTVLQSELGASLVITGISQADAQAFINSLRDSARQPALL